VPENDYPKTPRGFRCFLSNRSKSGTQPLEKLDLYTRSCDFTASELSDRNGMRATFTDNDRFCLKLNVLTLSRHFNANLRVWTAMGGFGGEIHKSFRVRCMVLYFSWIKQRGSVWHQKIARRTLAAPLFVH
jgi:hypothetical protein